MDIINNIVTPLFQLMFYLFMSVGFFYILIKIFGNFFSSIKWNFKYNIMGKDYDEETVEWCINALDNKMTKADAKRFLLMNGYPMKKVKEIMFVFNKIKKKLKGGKKDNGKTRHVNKKEVEEISEEGYNLKK